jgi:S-formylglutathione hydrolase FrmB
VHRVPERARRRGYALWLALMACLGAVAICAVLTGSAGGTGRLGPGALGPATLGAAGRGADTACGAGWDQTASIADSSAPDGQRRVWIHHPAGPDSATIPVLYLLHGFPSDPQALIDDEVPALEAEMCRDGTPFVLATPDGQAGTWDTEWGDDAAGRFALESFLTGPVIDATEGTQHRTAGLRAIGGYSMGGYGAAAIALRHPDTYGQVASFGGYYHVDDPDGVFAGDDAAHAPDQLVSDATASRLRFFLVEGVQEDTPLESGSIHGEADRFASVLRRHRVTVSVAHPPGGHDDAGWSPALPDCVRFLAAGWAGP